MALLQIYCRSFITTLNEISSLTVSSLSGLQWNQASTAPRSLRITIVWNVRITSSDRRRSIKWTLNAPESTRGSCICKMDPIREKKTKLREENPVQDKQVSCAEMNLLSFMGWGPTCILGPEQKASNGQRCMSHWRQKEKSCFKAQNKDRAKIKISKKEF